MIKEFRNEYKWLSNFEPCIIQLNGIKYQSVEHAYMSAKSNEIGWKKFCHETKSPGKVKIESKNIKLIKNWDNIKIDVMRECINIKFNQVPFKVLLIETGNEYIIEGNNWNDKFWGVCLKTNKGKNVLGKLIMEIREKLLK